MSHCTIESCGCSCHAYRVYSVESTAWKGMRARCLNKNSPKYPIYGGRGITICKRWESFMAFYEDMGPRPDPTYSLDRIDVNGNYEPGNVRWASKTIQAQNRRNRKGIYHRTRYLKNSKPWVVQIGVEGKHIHIGAFATESEAIEARKVAEKTYWANT